MRQVRKKTGEGNLNMFSEIGAKILGKLKCNELHTCPWFCAPPGSQTDGQGDHWSGAVSTECLICLDRQIPTHFESVANKICTKNTDTIGLISYKLELPKQQTYFNDP